MVWVWMVVRTNRICIPPAQGSADVNIHRHTPRAQTHNTRVDPTLQNACAHTRPSVNKSWRTQDESADRIDALWKGADDEGVKDEAHPALVRIERLKRRHYLRGRRGGKRAGVLLACRST